MNFNLSFKIADYHIQNYEKPFFVAEIGLNHNRDIEIAKKLIQKAKKIGASAVKFQSYITDEFIDKKCNKSRFIYEIFKSYEIDGSFHRKIKEIADLENILFFSTPLCDSSVDMLKDLKVQMFKIASGDIVNKSLLKKVASTQLPIFLSTGAANFYEIIRALEFLEKQGTKDICLLHCVSLYPTPLEKINIRTIELYKNIFPNPIGFSDHTIKNIAANTAVSLGACVIEKHFTLDKNLPGPDHKNSLEPDDFKQFIETCNQTWQSLGEYKKIPSKEEIQGRFFGRRSINKKTKKALPLRPDKSLEDKNFINSWN